MFAALTLALLGLIDVLPAGAQNVTTTGDNAVLTGCQQLSTAPSTCAGETINALGVVDAPTTAFPTTNTSGIAIGANLSNSNTGPPASGSATVTAGGSAHSAYLYVGFEKNTTGIVSITGAGSHWKNDWAASIGHYGAGTFTITDGGLFSQTAPREFVIGYYDTGVGSVHVDGVSATGVRSTLRGQNNIWLGKFGTGSLAITNGGYVSSDYTNFIGIEAGSSGTMTVDGVHAATGFRSTYEAIHNNIQIAEYGTGTVHVINGGLIKVPGVVLLGRYANADGILNVDGVNAITNDRSSVETAVLRVGEAGQGELNVTNGASFNANGTAAVAGYIGAGWLAGGKGTINIDGVGSTLTATGIASIGNRGTGTLNLSRGGTLAATEINLAVLDDSQGTINIGTGGQAGIVDAPTIRGGAGTGGAFVNFNHSDDITFAPQLTGTLQVNKVNSGTTTLNAANDYTGATNVSGGILAAASNNRFSASSNHDIGASGTLRLNGYTQSLLSLKNAGMVQFGGQAGTELIIKNDYAGNGGTLALNTVLGNDISVTDKLIVAGSTTGQSTISVTNLNGAGAQTTEGIKIVDVTGTSNGSFSLLGNTSYEGASAVVGGAYAYRLYQGGKASPGDGDWYLRSTLQNAQEDEPLYQPGVSSYEAYPQYLLGLNSLSTLQKRVGNRYWRDANGTSSINDGDVTGGNNAREESGAMWIRFGGEHTKISPKFSSSNSQYKYDTYDLQLGHDGMLLESDKGKLVGGVFVHYVYGTASTKWRNGKNGYGDGEISTNGYGFGSTLTWYGQSGFYIDGVAKVSWYNSNLSANPGHLLKKGNDAFGYALSVESGKRISLNEQWSVTPQLQLLYSKARFDSFNDTFGAFINPARDDSLQARLGMSVERKINRTYIYGIANVYNDFLSGTSVVVGDTLFESRKQRLSASIGVGGSYDWDNGKYSIYGEGSFNSSLAGSASYGYGGTVGVRVKW